MQALEDHKLLCKTESGYGSETNLKRHPSLGSLASTASASVASTGSFRVMISFVHTTKEKRSSLMMISL